MDLVLSAHAVGLLSAVAVGCVAAGAFTSRLLGRRGSPPPPAGSEPSPDGIDHDPARLGAGARVGVAGRLHVDGSSCPRLEDGAPVAATTFLERTEGGHTRGVCARAAVLWLEVAGARIELCGRVVVEVGSEEHYPPGPLGPRRVDVASRVLAAEEVPLGKRRDVPAWGVFRSLRPGDAVMVVGRVEHLREPARGQAGWHLVPDDSGKLTACYQRRPRIRGAFGAMQLWAAALSP